MFSAKAGDTKPGSDPAEKIAKKKKRPTVRVTVHGGAMTVTGSRYLIESDKTRLLVDCGLFQGKKELRLRNWQVPSFNPQALSAVILTHAHVDHTGYLPILVRQGFSGPIYCTQPTLDLLKLVLPDSAHLQEEEAAFASKHGTSKHAPAKPLYTAKDVNNTLPLMRAIAEGKSSEVCSGVHVFPHCAGHILGSASLTFEIQGRRITFSGDVGRYSAPILRDPQPAHLGDLLFCESTYGDRLHENKDVLGELARVVRQAAERSGPLIIPSFAIGRTQTLLYYLAELERKGVIPGLPVYVDSPMAVDVTAIYNKFKDEYDEEALGLRAEKKELMLTSDTRFCRTAEDSKRLNSLRSARIIISASGMVNGGRVLHHMRHWLAKEETTVLFVGYQAQGTRGQIIQSGAEEVKIFGEYVPIRAQVETISGFSAHADRDELLRWLRSCSGRPGLMKVTHGEPAAARSFAETAAQCLGWKAEVAEDLECVEI